jgi:hypothetical protein
LDLHSPLLTPEQMEAIKAMSFRGWETRVRGGAGGPGRPQAWPAASQGAEVFAS